MPAKSVAQRKGLLSMDQSDKHDFAVTKEKNLPQKAGKKKKGFRI